MLKALIRVVCLLAIFSSAVEAGFPIVAAETDAETNNALVFIEIPTGTVSGNLLILLVSSHSGGSITGVPAGWTLLNADTSFNPTTWAYYRVADGSETHFQVSTGDNYVVKMLRITGYTGTPELAKADGSSGTTTPTALTPSWGSALTLWIAVGNTANGSCPFTGYPSGYGGTWTGSSFNGPTISSCMATATKSVAASTQTPGTFATTVTTNAWVAYTIGVEGTGSLADPAWPYITQRATWPATLLTVGSLPFQMVPDGRGR